jgi:hypothetical protein
LRLHRKGIAMNRAQKIAWFLITVLSVTAVLTLVAFGILYAIFGVPIAFAAFGFAGLSGLAGFAPMIFKKDAGAVDFDERDILINRRAALAGAMCSFLFVGLACMVPFFVLGPMSSIRVGWLPSIFGGAGLTIYIVHSVMILVQYGREGKSNE